MVHNSFVKGVVYVDTRNSLADCLKTSSSSATVEEALRDPGRVKKLALSVRRQASAPVYIYVRSRKLPDSDYEGRCDV